MPKPSGHYMWVWLGDVNVISEKGSHIWFATTHEHSPFSLEELLEYLKFVNIGINKQKKDFGL
ncbi:MAG: hypothetical protein BWY93_00503 [Euryarchaeota archaeon ADurb.BinA087]|nr:MAG: hypothetical protein BWY93_00503 [Euryarchaeota archaeon ADurb.BinA087]